jgi:hypothetical protein
MAVGGELRVSAGGGRLFGHGGSSRRRLGAGGARQVSGRRGDGARRWDHGVVPVASQVSSTEWLVLHYIYLESRREYVSLLEHFPFSQYSARINSASQHPCSLAAK